MTNPYIGLPERAFWRSAVTERDALDPGDLYTPKFKIDRSMRIVTAGSCFAQHVGRTLRNAGFNVVDTEPLPVNVSDATANRFGYRLYSARYGNIYTVRQLLQLYQETRGKAELALPVWERDGRFFDAMRPAVEPMGLDSAELVLKHRERHLKNVRKAFMGADLFVFTLGLTEAWMHRETGTVYSTAPGVIAGEYDPEVFEFKNFRFDEIYADFMRFRKFMKRRNPDLKFLVTTSPVPLTATASGQHVEVATSYSKAVLRSVCGALYDECDDVEYFPSYEVITSANNKGAYFAPNKRSVTSEGVGKAMSLFLSAHDDGTDAPEAPTEADIADVKKTQRAKKERRRRRAAKVEENEEEMAEFCEDVLLEAFQK